MRSGEGRDDSSAFQTNTRLLEELQDPHNQTVWHGFGERYRPMLMSYARRSFGLSAQDAEDTTQSIMMAFFEAYLRGDYEREKGRLRKWLFGIATNVLRNFIRRRARNKEVQPLDQYTGTGFMARIPDDASLESAWEEEWRRAVYRKCMAAACQDFDEKTLEAFNLFARDGLPAESVGEQLGMTANAVYLARHRILKRIRELIPKMERLE